MIFPKPLGPGSHIHIVSPGTAVKPEYIDEAAKLLRGLGFVVDVHRHAFGPADGSFASSRETRLADLKSALLDPEADAVLCARGGYGCVQLIADINPEDLAANPKWLIGFSDVSALHAMMHRAGIASIHAGMAKQISQWDGKSHDIYLLLKALRGAKEISYHFPGHPFNCHGLVKGRIIGGNLAVLNGLAATPFDMLTPPKEPTILFLEDVGEKIYAVERMLYRLWLAGTLQRVNALLVGNFSNYEPDKNYPDMETMIRTFLDEHGLAHLPVAFNFPVGHEGVNMPVVEGSIASVKIGIEESHIKMEMQ